MNKLIFLVFLLVIFGCKTKPSIEKEEKKISGEIIEVILDHVMAVHWCRNPTVYYKIAVLNNTCDTINLNKVYVGGCEYQVSNPNLWCEFQDSSRVVAFPWCPENNLILYPNQQDTIKVKLLLQLFIFYSLNEILEKYKNFITQDFEIKSINFLENDTIFFKKAKDCKMTLKLDDEIILTSDTVKMNMINPFYLELSKEINLEIGNK